jgi:hypothetical protein
MKYVYLFVTLSFSVVCCWIAYVSLLDHDIIGGLAFGLVTLWWSWKSAGLVYETIHE